MSERVRLTWKTDSTDKDETGVPESTGLSDVERCGHGGGLDDSRLLIQCFQIRNIYRVFSRGGLGGAKKWE
jgi:hypothetical protein